MEVFVSIFAPIAVGLVVGLLSGLLGIGGGTVLVPVFKLGFGMSALASTATSLFTIIPTSISGSVTHIRNKTCIPILGIAAGLGGACTSPVGVWLASISPDWATMVAAALVIGYSAVTMFQKAMKLKRAESAARSEAKDDAGASENTLDNLDASRGKLVGIGALVGLLAGVVSGYVGVGGGFLMVPVFMQLLNIPMKLTSGTSLLAVMILAVPGTVTQAVLGNVDWMAGIMVAIGAIPGATIGSRLIKKAPELTLRFMFSAFLLVAAAMLVIDQLHLI